MSFLQQPTLRLLKDNMTKIFTTALRKVKSNLDGKEKVGNDILKNPTVLISYSQKIDDVYENLEDYNPAKKGDMIYQMQIMV